MGQFTLCEQRIGVAYEIQTHVRRREETLATGTGFVSVAVLSLAAGSPFRA